jgi:YidC/Oxa1 family membrane protein insertase
MLDFIIYPFANVLLFLYQYLGHQTVLAIAALTVLTRLLILPLTLSQQRSAQKMQELQPEIEKLREKYGDDQEKLAQKQMALWREAGVNPAGGCLPLLIQLPIMIALYRAIIFCVPSTPLQLFQFSGHIFIDQWLPSLSGLVPLQSTFLGMDLGQPPSLVQWWSYALPALVFATSWLQQKLLTPGGGGGGGDGGSQAEMMSQQMQLWMPLMFGVISVQYATGLSIYFIISNLFGMAQYYFLRTTRDEDEESKVISKKRPKK